MRRAQGYVTMSSDLEAALHACTANRCVFVCVHCQQVRFRVRALPTGAFSCACTASGFIFVCLHFQQGRVSVGASVVCVPAITRDRVHVPVYERLCLHVSVCVRGRAWRKVRPRHEPITDRSRTDHGPITDRSRTVCARARVAQGVCVRVWCAHTPLPAHPTPAYPLAQWPFYPNPPSP